MLSYLCASSTPVFCTVGVPVGTVPYSFTTFATLGFATITNLLVVGNVVAHLTFLLLVLPV
jgi:hypothetical protein